MIMGKLSIVQLKLLSASVHVNCFLLYDSQSGEAAVIDPGGGLGEILAELSSRALKLKYIILTHGHFDHTLCTASLKLATGAQVCMHRGDMHLKDDPCENATRFVGVENIKPFRVDVFLEDGSELKLGNEFISVLHTPGHTPGEISLYIPGSLFCGDTVLRGTTGRLDLPGADAALAAASVREKILTLPGETVIYCGHGENSCVAWELENNEVVKSPQLF